MRDVILQRISSAVLGMNTKYPSPKTSDAFDQSQMLLHVLCVRIKADINIPWVPEPIVWGNENEIKPDPIK